jgi:hypothetical protein
VFHYDLAQRDVMFVKIIPLFRDIKYNNHNGNESHREKKRADKFFKYVPV